MFVLPVHSRILHTIKRPVRCTYAPINVIPHLPPPGHKRENGRDLILKKIKFSTHGGTTSGQSMAAVYTL